MMATEQVTLVLDKANLLNNWSSLNSDGQQQKSLCSRIKRMPLRALLALLFGLVVIVLLLTLLNGKNSNRVNSALMFYQLQNDINTKLGNQTLAEYLESEVRVLCWIMTSPANHKSKALHVKKTWGKRCTKLLFVTTQVDDELETLIIDIDEKYANIWGKTRNAFKYLYENHLNDFDWFMKADDDTYVFMENLRYMLYPYSPHMPLWFGFNFKLGSKNPLHKAYMSGGSGYTLSQEALRRFGDFALNSKTGCKLHDNTGAEDVEMGFCLSAANVIAADSRDNSLKFRYVPFMPDGILISNVWKKDFWFQKQSFFHVHMGSNSLSNYAVAFHYVSPEEMHMFEYLKYEFEAVGLAKSEESLPQKLRDDEVVAPISDNQLGYD